MGCRGCGSKVKAAAKASLKTAPIHKPSTSQLPLTASAFQQMQGNQDTSTQNLYREFTSEELARVHTA